MQIKGTSWYTARKTIFTPIEGSERTQVQNIYGYRMPVGGRDEKEVKELMNLLKADGITSVLRTSEHHHLGIPAGMPFIEVLDEESAIALEKTFLKNGIRLPTDRYKEQGLGYINRTPKAELAPVVKKSFFDRLFGRK